MGIRGETAGPLKSHSVRRIITWGILAAVLLAMTLSSVGILSLQRAASRKRAENELRSLAGVIGGELARAVHSRDRDAAGRVLDRLNLHSEISQAHLFFPESGEIFASTPADESVPLEVLALPRAAHPDRDGIWLIEEVRDDLGHPCATIALRSPMTSFKEEQARSIRLLAAAAVVVLVAALVLAGRVQRGPMRSLFALERSVQEIAARGDPRMRVAKTSEDEIGRIADRLNDMLDAVETRTRAAEESGSAYRALFDGSPFAVFLTRKNGEIVDVNERGLQEFGLERSRIQGSTAETAGLIDREAARALAAALRRSGGVIERFETTLRAGGGRIRHVLISARAIPFRGEDPVMMVLQDVTERKLAEEALRESERIYREAIEGAGAVPYAKTEDPRRYVFMGEGIKELTGYSGQEMTPDLWNSIVRRVVPQGELFGSDLQQALRMALEGDLHSWKADVLLQTRDGEPRWVTDSSVILRDPEGRMLGSVGILADITDRKRAEEALRLGEERFRTLVTNLQVIAFALDAQGVFTLSEGLGLEKLGQRPGQLVGLSVFDVYSGHPEFLAQVRRALAGEPVLAELGLMGLTFELRYTPVRDHRGEPGGVIAVAFDITERTRAEEEIRTLNLDLERRVRDRTARLEAANRELEAFAYSVSHDLRAPLRAVDGFSQALLEDYAAALDARGKGYLERIRSGAARMGHLIDDLLRLSRLSNAEIRLEEVDLSAMVGSVVAELRETSPRRQVDCVITPGIHVVADRALTLIALENLLRNAWKFTGRRTEARIEFGRMAGEGGEAVCYVRDNGAGFDMAYASKLFGVFQRLHDQHEFPGSGIGLATVQRILHRHGGRVWAEGEVDRGATVYFQFPPAPVT